MRRGLLILSACAAALLSMGQIGALPGMGPNMLPWLPLKCTGGTITTSGPGFAIEADSGTFMVRDGVNMVTATPAAQAFPGTTVNVQVI